MLYTTNVPMTLFAGVLTGSLAAFIAYRRGKSPFAWFIIGFLFGLLGIIAFFFAAPLTKKSRKRKSSRKAPIQKPIPQPCLMGPADKFWYYVNSSREQIGPMSHKGITDAWKEGKVLNTSLVWHEELAEWKPLQELISLPEQASS